ncbi:tlde1 domain-containing protein [Novosphingobium colocasiae]|uniref:tlde1 domain-containing protein n=1 Tax=Novosphingobium colocasiae TaxID=1256513 RepID=UPI0035B37BBB
MFTYEQGSGRFVFGRRSAARLIAVCYAGAPGFVNDPATDHLRGKGPLPKGRYVIRETPHSRFHKPAFYLAPVPDAAAGDAGFDPLYWLHGRSDFWVHGDNALLNRTASHGCIVMPLPARLELKRLLDLRRGVPTPILSVVS